MAKQYQVKWQVRLVNGLMQVLLKLGIAPKHIYLLTVRGRKTGKLYSTPITLVEEKGKRWLVAPYGEVNWVKNARAAKKVTLRRGGRTEVVALTELNAKASAPVLKQYVTDVAITRPYFDVKPEAALEAFIAEAPRHPVFLLRSSTTA